MAVFERFKLKWAVVLFFAVVLTGAVFFVLRGPYISNFFKKLLLSEMEKATGRQVIAEKMFVNLFPPFVEAKGIKAFDGEGVRVFTAERVKGYIGLSGILRRKIEVERVVVIRPNLWSNRAQLDEIIDNYKKYSGKKKKGLISVEVKAIIIEGGEVSYFDEKANAVTTAEGLDIELLLREEPELGFSIGGLAVSVRDWPVMKGRLKGGAVIKENAVVIKRLTINSDGSGFSGSGSYSGGKGNFNLDIDLLVETLKNLFGLKKPSMGAIHASGIVTVPRDIRETAFDLKINGDFYLETLMELLGSQKDYLKGPVSFDGVLGGKLTAPRGTVKAKLKKGGLFGIDLDELECVVDYKDGLMSFTDGKGRLYGGRAIAEASINIPAVKPYSVNVNFIGVSSDKAAALVGLSWLGLPDGKVTGEMRTSGDDFNPEGHVYYEAIASANTIVGKVRTIKGNYAVKDWNVGLSGFEIQTGHAAMSMEGTVDVPSKSIDIKSLMKTYDVGELTGPYFPKLIKGKGEISLSLNGGFADPQLDAHIGLKDASVEGHMLGDVEGDFSYTRELLKIKSVKAVYGESRHEAEGTVAYALDSAKRSYDVLAYAKNADIKNVLHIFGLEADVKGVLDGLAAMKGNLPVYSGSVSIEDAEVYGLPGVSASFGYSYDGEYFSVKDAVAVRNGSSAKLYGKVSKADFYFKASSERMLLSDAFAGSPPFDYTVGFESEGRGTFEAPDIALKANLSKGSFRGADIGGGLINATLKGKEAEVEASLLDGRTTIAGKASLVSNVPWSAELSFEQGRYDFLLSSFMKTLPEDLLLNMEGRASLIGDRENISASIILGKLNLNLFGQGLTNDSNVEAQIENKELRIKSFAMRGGAASVSASGMLRFGEYYDISFSGNSSLSPLMAVSKKIAVIRGKADFAMAIKGDWETPVFNGDLTISDASFGIKAFPQRLTSINGQVTFDNSKASIKHMVAKLGGGDIGLTGMVGLEGFEIRQIYLDAMLSDVTLTPMKDFSVNIGGDLLLRGTWESRYITGRLQINKAKYRKDLELTTWLLERRKEVPKTETSWFENTALNVNLYGDKDIQIDNNVARTPIKIDLVARGTVGVPRIFGRVESGEGKVYFRNKEFKIQNASADFNDPQRTDPFVDIAAETSIRGYHVWLNLEGRMEQLNMTLASDPPLDEVDILGLLTVGRFGETLKGLEGGVGAAEATAFITGKVQDVVEERLRDITGFSRVRIVPYISKSSGTLTSRITVSKTLMEEKLFVTYSTAVGMAEDELLMEFLLGRNVSLQGMRDDRGTVGGDVKFRFNFK